MRALLVFADMANKSELMSERGFSVICYLGPHSTAHSGINENVKMIHTLHGIDST